MATEDEPDRRRELGGFLRAHRELLAPEAVGLPRSPRRRTPGLRREEVAALSGVGVAWYTWLEQGRVDTSRQVLEAVSRALRLDPDARRHVLELAGFHVPAGPGATPADGLRAMVESWPATPALVLDRALDVLAWNDAWRATWPDPGAVPTERRNLLLMLLTDPAYEPGFPERETIALDLVRHLRTRPDDARDRAIAADLRAARPDLAAWWHCRAVGVFATRTVRVWGPAARAAGRSRAAGGVAGAPSEAERSGPVDGDGTGEGRDPRGVPLRFTMSLLMPAEAPETTVLVCTPADAETIGYVTGGSADPRPADAASATAGARGAAATGARG
ncbi:helix-turn-helix domain-containing protein [Embleya sp. NPDC001921]